MLYQNLSRLRVRRYPILYIFVGLLLTLFAWPFATQAQTAPTPDPSVCYAIADNQGKLPDGSTANNQDQLVQMNRFTAATTVVGATNTLNVEAMTFVPTLSNNVLYAEDGGMLGTVDLTTGAFTGIGAAGSGTGAAGIINFRVIIGLAYDMQTDTLYATQSKVGQNAILLKIDRQTGAHVPNAFGVGQDYLVIPPVSINGQPAQNVDDFEYDPTSGLLYGLVNLDGADGKLIILDPTTATVTEVGLLQDATTGDTVDNLEGLSFDVTGQLYASSGNHGPHPQDKNKLWRVDKQTGAATLVGPFTPGQVDYEALGCLTTNPAVTSTPTATATDTPTPTSTDTSTATSTPTPTATATDTPTPTSTDTSTVTSTPTPLVTDTLTPTPSITQTPTPTETPANPVVPPLNTATPTPTRTVEPPTGLDPSTEPSAPQTTTIYLPLISSK